MRALKILCLACALAFAVAGMTACGGKAKNIETAEVSLSQTEYVYDGTEKKPAATVKLGETTLSADRLFFNVRKQRQRGYRKGYRYGQRRLYRRRERGIHDKKSAAFPRRNHSYSQIRPENLRRCERARLYARREPTPSLRTRCCRRRVKKRIR